MKNKGITLVEITVVLSIILILAIIGIPEYFNFRDKAVRQDALGAAKELANAMEMYKVEFAGYPPDGSVTMYLSPYVEVTRLMRPFDPNNTDLSPYQGVKIYEELSGEVVVKACIYGAVRRITPEYYVTYCVDSDNSNSQIILVDQPTCCWKETDGNCPLETSWYSCRERM